MQKKEQFVCQKVKTDIFSGILTHIKQETLKNLESLLYIKRYRKGSAPFPMK